MFEEAEPNEDKDSRSRLLMFGSAAAVLLVLVLVVVIGSRSSKPAAGEVDLITRGAPGFEIYEPLIKIDQSGENDKMTAQNLLGNFVGTLRARVTNTGDRTLIGLKLRAVAVGFSQETLIDKIVTPVPRVQETLEPGETFHAEVLLDRIPPPDQIQDMRIELYAFKLK